MDGAFLRKLLTAESHYLFSQSSSIVDIRMGSNSPLIDTLGNSTVAELFSQPQKIPTECSFHSHVF